MLTSTQLFRFSGGCIHILYSIQYTQHTHNHIQIVFENSSYIIFYISQIFDKNNF